MSTVLLWFGMCVVVIGLGIGIGYMRARRRHRPLPPGNDRGWTNNTIRRQGESGKGIR